MADAEKDTTRFDVVIVGAGPVGLTLAVALARFLPGIAVGIVERRIPAVPSDMRASAIAAGGVRLFSALGVWRAMADKANPIAGMKITDSGSGDIARPLFLHFEGDVAPGEPFAHMVPNRASAPALLDAANNSVTWLAPAVVAGLETDARAASLLLEDGRKITASLVVAADGGRSALRKMAGIEVFSHAYQQSGVVTTIAHDLLHNDIAHEHFRPAGPFASLPLKGKHSSLVWTETPERATALTGMEPQKLAGEIETVMGSTLGTVRLVDPVQSFPLNLVMARSFIAPRLALIGDAAHVVHPIAGQGLNLGLKDVAALAEIIVEAARLGRDLGAADVLADYDRARRFDTGLMAMACDGLNRLFSNDLAPLRALRDFGLSMVDRVGPVKKALIAHAAGTQGSKLLEGRPL